MNSIKLPQKQRESVDSEQGSFSFSASSIIINKPLFKKRLQYLITQTMLNNSVSISQGMNRSLFGFIHIKTIIASDSVCFILKFSDSDILLPAPKSVHIVLKGYTPVRMPDKKYTSAASVT